MILEPLDRLAKSPVWDEVDAAIREVQAAIERVWRETMDELADGRDD
jgi:hypothetical protein